MAHDGEAAAVQGLTSSAWRALAEISGRTAEELFDPLCFVENPDTDTQARAHCSVIACFHQKA